MKIIYMGTPDFAVPSLEALIKAGYEITLVVTQPDRQKGRGKEVAMSPVKECALKYNIPVFQPLKIKDKENVDILRKYEADIMVVAAFGQILSEEILNMTKYGCINIHASLLPEYRGAAPIQWAVLDGKKKTGVTIQQMAKGVDTGDILAVSETEIGKEDTGESMFDRLMELGAELLIKTLPDIENGKVVPIKQDEAKATHAGKITKEMGLINWNDSAEKIERYVRGLNSWPSAYTVFKNKTLKIWKSELTSCEDNAKKPGSIIKLDKDYIFVQCGDGALKVSEVQLEGKKRMSVHDFLLGFPMAINDILGE